MIACLLPLLPLLPLSPPAHLPPILFTLTSEGRKGRGGRASLRPSIKSPSRKTAPIDNRDDKAPNDFSRCLRHQNRDHYIAPPLPSLSPMVSLPPSAGGNIFCNEFCSMDLDDVAVTAAAEPNDRS